MHNVWILIRQSKDAYEPSWILWNVVDYKLTSEEEMKAYVTTWDSCNGLAMSTSFSRTFCKELCNPPRSCLKSSIRKITLFLLILSYFGVELSSLNSHVTITYHLVANKKTMRGAGWQRSGASIRFQRLNQPQRGYFDDGQVVLGGSSQLVSG